MINYLLILKGVHRPPGVHARCMTWYMNVDELRGICKDCSRWLSIVSAYCHGKKVYIYCWYWFKIQRPLKILSWLSHGSPHFPGMCAVAIMVYYIGIGLRLSGYPEYGWHNIIWYLVIYVTLLSTYSIYSYSIP